MCLHRLEKFPVPKDHIGWKIFFRPMKNILTYRFLFLYPYKDLKSNVWLKREIEWLGNYYSGFHVYVNRSDAINTKRISKDVLKKVKFGSVICTGYEKEVQVIVAKSIKIL